MPVKLIGSRLKTARRESWSAIWARVLPGRRYALFLGAEAALFLLASSVTLAGAMLP